MGRAGAIAKRVALVAAAGAAGVVTTAVVCVLCVLHFAREPRISQGKSFPENRSSRFGWFWDGAPGDAPPYARLERHTIGYDLLVRSAQGAFPPGNSGSRFREGYQAWTMVGVPFRSLQDREPNGTHLRRDRYVYLGEQILFRIPARVKIPALLGPAPPSPVAVVPLTPMWPGLLGNVALYASAWWGVGAAAALARRAWRRRAGRCARCVYPVRGLERCPECGMPVSNNLT